MFRSQPFVDVCDALRVLGGFHFRLKRREFCIRGQHGIDQPSVALRRFLARHP